MTFEPRPVDFARAMTVALALLEKDLEAVEKIVGDGDRELCLALASVLVAFLTSALGDEGAAKVLSDRINVELEYPIRD